MSTRFARPCRRALAGGDYITAPPPLLSCAANQLFRPRRSHGSRCPPQNGKVDRQEAIKFWGKNFAKVNANAMFNEVDVDKDGELTLNEWKDFWRNVLKHDYKAEDVLEEVSDVEGCGYGRRRTWQGGREEALPTYTGTIRALASVCAGEQHARRRQLGRLERRPHYVKRHAATGRDARQAVLVWHVNRGLPVSGEAARHGNCRRNTAQL